jgi:hypothetical protein
MNQPSDPVAYQILKLSRKYEVPDYVKSAALADLTNDDLPDDCFADTGRRLPCHCKAATLMSYLTIADDPDTYSRLPVDSLRKLAKAAAIFEIADDIRKIQNPVKSAKVADTIYAFVDTIDGQTVTKLPLRSPAEVAKAAAYLVKHADAFSATQRLETARRIAIRPGVSDEHIDAIEKMAAIGEANGRKVSEALSGLAYDIGDKSDSELNKMAKLCQSIETLDSETLYRVVKLAAESAEAKGQKFEYEALTEPASQIKTAKESQVKLANGFTVSQHDLVQLDADKVQAILGKEACFRMFPIGIRSLPVVKQAAQDLSEAEADELVRLLKSAGAKVNLPTEKMTLESLAV